MSALIRNELAVPGRVGQSHELVQDGKLQLQLNAVYGALHDSFDVVQLEELSGYHGNIHDDDGDIDPKELQHNTSDMPLVHGLQKPHRGPDINARDDELLDAENGDLDLLHGLKARVEEFGIGRVGAIGKNGGGDVQGDGVPDYHDEHGADEPGLIDYDVQSRVQHH